MLQIEEDQLQTSSLPPRFENLADMKKAARTAESVGIYVKQQRTRMCETEKKPNRV
jgi:hypothetical protein